MSSIILIMKHIIFVVVLISGIQSLSAQDIFWTEEEISLQKIYIEANTQKILGNVDKALPLYQQVVKEKRNIHPAWYEIARMQHANEDNEAAFISIDKAIKLSSRNKWYTLFKVDLYEKMGLHDDAAEALSFYLQNDKDQNLLERLGYIYTKSQKVSKALEVYNQLESTYGIHESYSKKKYNLYLKEGQDELALKEISSLISAYPNNIEYMHLLASNMLQKNKNDEADKLFQRILAIDPDDTKASIAMAQTHREMGNSSEFIKSISSIISNPSLDIDVKIKELIPPLNQLVANYDPDLSHELTKSAKFIVKAHPDQPKAYAMASDIYFHSGLYGLAKESYKQTIQLDNTVYPVWEQYLYTLVILNNAEEILATVESALDVYPNQGRIYYFEALAHYKLNNFAAAESSLAQAELMSRKNPDLKQYIYILKAVLAAAKGSDTAAKNNLKLAIDINPRQTDHLLNNYIEDLNKNGEPAMIDHALSELKYKKTPSALFSSSLLSYISGNKDSARSDIIKAIAGTPYPIPKFLDLYIALHHDLISSAQNETENYSNILNKMGYQRIFNSDSSR